MLLSFIFDAGSMKAKTILSIVFSFVCALSHAQHTGHIVDAATQQSIPFATIRFDDNGNGMICDLNGGFDLSRAANGPARSIEISALGYKSQKIAVPLQHTEIRLQPVGNELSAVTITPPYSKIRRVLNAAIAGKAKNDPDKYDWYQCHVYYKMLADVVLPDSVLRNNISEDAALRRQFTQDQHLLVSETYSVRTWAQPQRLQEEVLASRISGLKKSLFTSLVTDVLPFHAYTDYLSLNGKDYHNPVSRGYEQYYRFNLADEIMDGSDTVWILSFSPKGHNANELKGQVFIHSDGYAISHIIAQAKDTLLRMNVHIEQQYQRVHYGYGRDNRWFPQQLNYILEWTQQSDHKEMTLRMKGNSIIDSVSWEYDPDFHFDKAHTVRLAPGADQLPDSEWAHYRPAALDKKEQRTYKVIDSLGNKIHLDDYMQYFAHIPEGKVSVCVWDFDLLRLFNYNTYEGVRLGAGVQTNDRLIPWLSVGGWAGYGFADAHWKYGGFAEAYADKNHEFVIRAGYTDDISDPGRIHLSNDLDKNYLRSYLLSRVDRVRALTASVRNKTGYWSWEIAATQQQIDPKYTYALAYDNHLITSFTAREASLSLRYAFAERTSPFFGYYYSMGSRYPIFYGKITTGQLKGDVLSTPYTQVLGAVTWNRHINRIGSERFLLEGGISHSDATLPASKLFAGNGYKYDSHDIIPDGIYAFGGLITMYPYEYYTDQFVQFIFRHDMDWKLYKLEHPKSKLSSAPNIGLQYGVLFGQLSDPGVQRLAAFSVPDNGYHEAGLLLNNILRLRSNLYYLTLHAGYFVHITPAFDNRRDSRLAFGLGFEL